MTYKGKHPATYLRRSGCHREDVQLGTSVLEEFAVVSRKEAQREGTNAAVETADGRKGFSPEI